MKELFDFIRERFKKKRLSFNLDGTEIHFDLGDDGDKTWSDRFEITITKLNESIYSILVYKFLKRKGKMTYEKAGYIEFDKEAVKKRLEDLYLELKIKKL